MPLPRMTLRRWMIAVAALSVAMGAFALGQRGEDRLFRAYRHDDWAESKQLSQRHAEWRAYQTRMAIKWRRAADRPWLAVPPDPAEPKPPPAGR